MTERWTNTAPLGVRFWDAAQDAAVCDGLRVTAHPQRAPLRKTEAVANRSAVFVFTNLPGLRGRGLDGPFAPFVVEVEDTRRRFLPLALRIDAPARGVQRAPLFSAPSRPEPPGWAVIRTELRDAVSKKPATGALVEARVAGAVAARSFADRNGRVLLLFPYPGAPPGAESPPASPFQPDPRLTELVWQVELHAAWDGPAPPAEVLLLDRALAQRPASLWADEACRRPLEQQALRFGEDLTVRSYAAGQRLSYVLLTPAASPV